MRAGAIERRLSAIETLKNAPTVLRAVREALKNVRDVERIVGRIAYNSLTPRHCLALGESFEAVPRVLSLLDGLQDPMLCEIRAQIDPLEDIAQRIRQMIQPDAPMTLADGGVIREGFDEELDSLRRAGAEGKQWISDMEQREREATGIKNLRIVFHKIFGYCIEVTKSFYDLVPLRYARRQTLANCERYVTPELQEMERKILGAADRAIRLEQELFAALKDYLAEGIERHAAHGGRAQDVGRPPCSGHGCAGKQLRAPRDYRRRQNRYPGRGAIRSWSGRCMTRCSCPTARTWTRRGSG